MVENVIDALPGMKQLHQLADLVGSVTHDVEDLITAAQKGHWLGHVETVISHTELLSKFLPHVTKITWDTISTYGTGQLYRTMLEAGLEVNYDELDHEAHKAIKTVDTMLTFAAALPVAFGALETVLHALLGQRAGSAFNELFGKIPEELGITWALGQQIDRAFETAVGTAIEEGINKQKRPTRIEWPVLRTMLRQRIITKKQARMFLANLGYPDELIGYIEKLDINQLQVGDLQKLWQYGIVDRAAVQQYLKSQGFEDHDVKHLLALYIDKAETAASAAYRQTARSLVRAQLIPESVYRQILDQVHVPETEVKYDLAALDLERSAGRIQTPLAAIKSGYVHGTLTASQVQDGLSRLGYSADAIAATVTAWDAGPIPHPMAASKVLSYWYSGVIATRKDAYDRLIATHIRPADADFLLDHPPAAGVRIRPLTPTLIVSAYLDGVINDEQMRVSLGKLGLTTDAVEYTARVAEYKKAHRRPPPSSTLALNAGEIREAFKYNILQLDEAQTRLEHLGYDADAAFMLLEITAKGKIGIEHESQGGRLIPMTLAEALGLLESRGFTILSPPDPLILEAEQIVEQAGYTPIPPPPTTTEPRHTPTPPPPSMSGGLGR